MSDSIRRLTVEQYHAMIRAGFLTEDDRVELLDGWLVRKMPKSPSHRVATGLVREALERAVAPGWHIDSQEPITLADSEPEPDAMVVRGSVRDYVDRHPGPGDVALVVEVSDASLDHDRTVKRNLYARSGIVRYWIVNLPDRRLEVFSLPSRPAAQPNYRRVEHFSHADTVPLVLDDRDLGRIAVRDLLP
jgi:Uma2 family endonuclease